MVVFGLVFVCPQEINTAIAIVKSPGTLPLPITKVLTMPEAIYFVLSLILKRAIRIYTMSMILLHVIALNRLELRKIFL